MTKTVNRPGRQRLDLLRLLVFPSGLRIAVRSGRKGTALGRSAIGRQSYTLRPTRRTRSNSSQTANGVQVGFAVFVDGRHITLRASSAGNAPWRG